MRHKDGRIGRTHKARGLAAWRLGRRPRACGTQRVSWSDGSTDLRSVKVPSLRSLNQNVDAISANKAEMASTTKDCLFQLSLMVLLGHLPAAALLTNLPVIALRCEPWVLPPPRVSLTVVFGLRSAVRFVTNRPVLALRWFLPPLLDLGID